MYDYWLKVNIAWALFYVFYRLTERGNTFFHFRRFFLLGIVLVALLCPLIDPFDWIRTEDYLDWWEYVRHWSGSMLPSLQDKTWDLNYWKLIYGGGVAWLGIRLCIHLAGVIRLKKRGRTERYGQVKVIVCDRIEAPFSFFRWIFVNPGQEIGKEMRQIVIHEKAHVDQKHWVDILVWEVICILFWYNPVVWLLRSEVRQNLEFLADREVLENGYDRREYQYLLLRRSFKGTEILFGNYLNVLELKKRIVMMNKKASSVWCFLRYILFLPLVGIWMSMGDVRALTSFSVSPEATFLKDTTVHKRSLVGIGGIKPLILLNGKKLPVDYDLSTIDQQQIKTISVIKGERALEKYGKEAKGGVIEIELKNSK